MYNKGVCLIHYYNFMILLHEAELIKNLNERNEHAEAAIEQEAVNVNHDQYDFVGATDREQEENDELPIDVNHYVYHNT